LDLVGEEMRSGANEKRGVCCFVGDCPSELLQEERLDLGPMQIDLLGSSGYSRVTSASPASPDVWTAVLPLPTTCILGRFYSHKGEDKKG